MNLSRNCWKCHLKRFLFSKVVTDWVTFWYRSEKPKIWSLDMESTLSIIWSTWVFHQLAWPRPIPPICLAPSAPSNLGLFLIASWGLQGYLVSWEYYIFYILFLNISGCSIITAGVLHNILSEIINIRTCCLFLETMNQTSSANQKTASALSDKLSFFKNRYYKG